MGKKNLSSAIMYKTDGTAVDLELEVFLVVVRSLALSLMHIAASSTAFSSISFSVASFQLAPEKETFQDFPFLPH